MKRILFITLALCSLSTYAQNTLPQTGDVGIGTTNPSAKLDVNGHTIVDSTLIVKDSVRFKDRLVVDKKVVFKENAVVKGNMRVETNARILNNVRVDHNIRVDGTSNLNGNVKMPNIGNPNNGVLNNQNYDILIKTENGNVKAMDLGQIIRIVYSKYDCNDPNQIPTNLLTNPTWSNGQNKIYTDLCNLVNVGIGTSSPNYKLDVRGTTYTIKIKAGNSSATDNAVVNAFASNPSQDIVNFGVKNAQTGQQSKVLFKVKNNGTVVMYNRTGSALISYNSAGNKILQLEDNGLLRAREIRIDESNWADYVFNEKYNLMNLTELANYIAKNNHLPNVPTANQIAREGLNIGDMQRIQMEKIEELTLYTIQMNNDIEALKNELSDLKMNCLI